LVATVGESGVSAKKQKISAYGVGGAKGMQAAQLIADGLVAFFEEAAVAPSQHGLIELMHTINNRVHALSLIEGSDRPLAAAAAPVEHGNGQPQPQRANGLAEASPAK
jgi:hypothetical protein